MKSSADQKIMNTSGTMMQADFDFDMQTKGKTCCIAARPICLQKRPPS
jgi:hypothetical protein